MDVAIELNSRGSTDDLHSLRQWIVDDDVLRGRVRLVNTPPELGTLGGVVETLAVALAPGGMATALASVLITWIRRRTGNVIMRITEPDGRSYEISASNVRTLSADEIKEITAQLARDLGDAQ